MSVVPNGPPVSVVGAPVGGGGSMAMRALVVDDDPWDRRRLAASLANAGYFVDVAASKDDGLRYGLEQAYDAIIVDLGLDDLPGGDLRGIKVIKRLRRRADSVPILIWSGRDDSHALRQGRLAGADAYLVKSPDKRAADHVVDALKALASERREQGGVKNGS